MKCYQVKPNNSKEKREDEKFRINSHKKSCKHRLKALKEGPKDTNQLSCLMYSTIGEPLAPYRVLGEDMFEVEYDPKEDIDRRIQSITNYFKEDTLLPIYRGNGFGTYLVVAYRVSGLVYDDSPTPSPMLADPASPAQIFVIHVMPGDDTTMEYYLNNWLVRNKSYYTANSKNGLYYGARIQVVPMDGSEGRDYWIAAEDMHTAIETAKTYIKNWEEVDDRNFETSMKAKHTIKKALHQKAVSDQDKKETEEKDESDADVDSDTKDKEIKNDESLRANKTSQEEK